MVSLKTYLLVEMLVFCWCFVGCSLVILGKVILPMDVQKFVVALHIWFEASACKRRSKVHRRRSSGNMILGKKFPGIIDKYFPQAIRCTRPSTGTHLNSATRACQTRKPSSHPIIKRFYQKSLLHRHPHNNRRRVTAFSFFQDLQLS